VSPTLGGSTYPGYKIASFSYDGKLWTEDKNIQWRHLWLMEPYCNAPKDLLEVFGGAGFDSSAIFYWKMKLLGVSKSAKTQLINDLYLA